MLKSITHGPAITANGVLAAGSPLHDNCIIDWELHQKIMAKKKTIRICTGVGLNMFFPEYITIELSDIDTEIRKPKKTKKDGKI